MKMKEIDNKFSGKIECISILRIIGALGVALYHMGFLNGYVKSLQGGVSLFFTISGFLLMYTTQKKQKYFLVKRFIRIVPLYWIMTIATFVAMNVFPSMALGEAGVIELIKSIFFIPYLRPAMKSADVVRPMVGPAWTLYYDVYFAIIFAVSMKISHKWRGVISGLVCAGLLLLDGKFEQTMPFFYILSEPWWISFIYGIAAFYMLKYLTLNIGRKDVRLQFSMMSIAITCLVLIYATRLDIYKDAFLAFVVLTCLVFAIGNKKLPTWISTLGDSSYSFYLIHYYVVLAMERIADMSKVSITAIISACMVIVISEVCASISYQLIEKRLGNIFRSILRI